jgi:predicted nucleic acid-binding protein
MTILVDSDILIEVLRGRETRIVEDWLKWSDSTAPIFYSPVSQADLWAGARPGEHGAIVKLFQGLQCVPIDEEIGHLAGDYLCRYQKSHFSGAWRCPDSRVRCASKRSGLDAEPKALSHARPIVALRGSRNATCITR